MLLLFFAAWERCVTILLTGVLFALAVAGMRSAYLPLDCRSKKLELVIIL